MLMLRPWKITCTAAAAAAAAAAVDTFIIRLQVPIGITISYENLYIIVHHLYNNTNK